jgi:two-component system chemotaxis response regulator CheB
VAERNIIVIGCSVGGVEALQQIVAPLPGNFQASLFVVLHVSPQSTSVLPDILSRAGRLRATHAVDGEAIRPAHIYVAPPDYHLVLERNKVRVIRGPKENRHRPAIDPLFRSAARAFGPRVIGVILTGALNDGTAGLLSIKHTGGIAIAQDPQEAMCGDMPRSAIENANVDYVVPVREIPPLLEKLVAQQVEGNGAGRGSRAARETKYAELDMDAVENENRPGVPSPFSCPECGGVLWELVGEEMLRFRCRVGHAYTAESLNTEQTEVVEGALWAAMRALEEGASLSRRMADKAKKRGNSLVAKRFEESAEGKMEQAHLLRKLILESKEAPVG